MAKVTAQQIKDLGFTAEMFRKGSDIDLTAYIDGVIAEQSALLSGRIGAATYDSTASPDKENVARAEKCLTAAELCDRRINVLLDQVTDEGREIPTKSVERQRDKYRDEAERLFPGCTGVNTSGGFASGVVETSHFDSQV